MDVRDHTAARNGGLDERVELLVTTNGELQVAWSDALHLEILGSVSGQLEDLSAEVLEDSSQVDWSASTDTAAVVSLAEETVDATHGELESGAR